MFTTLAQVPQNLQQSQMNQQTIQANQYKLDRQGEADLVARIEGAGNYRINSSDPDAAFDTYDFYRLAQENPKLAADVLNRDPDFNVAIDEKGRRIQTKVSGFDINPDTGDVVVKVIRPDGREVPVTQNRTAQDNDVVVNLSKDDFQKFGQNTMRQMIAIGGGANNNTFRRDANLLIEQAIKERTLNNIKQSPISENPGATTQLGAIVTNADPDSVKEIAADQGVDIQAVEAEVIGQMEQSGNYSTETIADARENGINSVQMAVDEASSTNPEERLELNFDLSTLSEEDLATKAGRLIKNIVEKKDKKTGGRSKIGANQRLAALENHEKALNKRLKNLDSLEDASGFKNTRAIKKINAELATIKKYRDHVSSDGNVKSELDENASDQVKGISSEEALNSAISNGQQPSDQDYQQAGNVLQKYGVGSKEELYKLPSKELMQVAFMMASRQGGTVQDKMGVAQELVNFGMTGSKDTDAKDIATLQSTNTNTELRQAEFVRGVQNDLTDRLGKYNDAMDSSIDALGEIKLGTLDEDGDPIAPTPEMSVKVGKIWDKSMSLAGDERMANQSIALEATMYHLQGIKADSSPGWLDFSDRLENWFNDNGGVRVGKNSLSALLRAETDPKSGALTAFYFRDPNGGKYNFPMSPEKFKDIYGAGAMESLKKLALQNTTNERRNKVNASK
jgi:hypothetical protein